MLAYLPCDIVRKTWRNCDKKADGSASQCADILLRLLCFRIVDRSVAEVF